MNDSTSARRPGRAPNIVIIQADQLAAAALGAYGNGTVLSPHMDALAADGVVFDRAYCTSPLCAPSRASMLTGRLPSEIGAYDNAGDFGASVPTFAHHLRAAGYHTALIGRMHFIGPDQHHGFEQRLTTDVYPADLDMVPDWDLPDTERLPWYHDAASVFTAGASTATVQRDFDDEVGFRTLRYLNDRVRARDGRPFLLVSSFIHPHDPYEPPPEHWRRYDDVEIDSPRVPALDEEQLDPHSRRLQRMSGFDKKQPTEQEVRNARRAYYACVSYVDDHVGRIMERLDELGLRDDTVVIVTSDHGDMLGERGLWYKMSPFEQSARVPLIVHGTDRFAPRRVGVPVSLTDLMPTLIELAGAEPGEARLSGRSLVGLVTGAEGTEGGPDAGTNAGTDAGTNARTGDRDVVIEYLAEGVAAPQLTLVRGRYKLVVCPGDPDQLFDVEDDPDELHDRAADPAMAELVERLRGELIGRYDVAALTRSIRSSQQERRLVRSALATGEVRHWDHEPTDPTRYVRGDFWSALERGRIPARADAQKGSGGRPSDL